MSNPLFNVTGLPPFKKIQPSHMVEAIETIINDSRQAINELTESVTDDNITWDNFVKPLEDINDRLDRAWSPISHINSVANSDDVRDAYNACLPLLSD